MFFEEWNSQTVPDVTMSSSRSASDRDADPFANGFGLENNG